MIKIESTTLEEAFKNAATTLACSVTELNVEVIQYPSKGVLGLFKKNAVIVAAKKQLDEMEIPKEEKVPEQSKEKRSDRKTTLEKKEVESSPIQTSSTEEVAKKTTPSIRKPYKPAQRSE
ncbi:MAG: Jag N-terminal domain-containing protein, partial [Sulfurimonadaceae bacterium]|nr:Jag N-terminal domain-containing protein [Sulfurimonadaceae bacterium]